MRAACDVLAPVYLATGGEDGFVSIEVSPHLARDTEGSAAEAHRLFTAVDRPNVFVKIPGTREGVPAILQCLKDGLNINITLLFSLTQYEAVADAYLEALEYRLRQRPDHPRHLVGGQLLRLAGGHARGQAAGREGGGRRRRRRSGGASSPSRAAPAWPTPRSCYERFRSYLNSREWQLIAASGAKVQRVLWASTGVKDPAYPDTLYVDELIGEHTVTTLPEATWKAFKEHGTAGAHRRPAPRRRPPAGARARHRWASTWSAWAPSCRARASTASSRRSTGRSGSSKRSGCRLLAGEGS